MLKNEKDIYRKFQMNVVDMSNVLNPRDATALPIEGISVDCFEICGRLYLQRAVSSHLSWHRRGENI